MSEGADDTGQADDSKAVEHPQKVQATLTAEVTSLPIATKPAPDDETPIVPAAMPAMYQDRGHAGRVAKRRQDNGTQLKLF